MQINADSRRMEKIFSQLLGIYQSVQQLINYLVLWLLFLVVLIRAHQPQVKTGHDALKLELLEYQTLAVTTGNKFL